MQPLTIYYASLVAGFGSFNSEINNKFCIHYLGIFFYSTFHSVSILFLTATNLLICQACNLENLLSFNNFTTKSYEQ